MPSYKELLLQIEDLKQQAAAQRKTEVQSAILRVKEIISEYELTLEDLGLMPVNKQTPKKRGPAPIKYQDTHSGNTWTGRGRLPQWLAEMEARGRSRNQFLVR